jgi:hypothetical protein
MSLLDKILLLIGAGSCLLGVRKLKDGNKEKEYGGQE